MPRVFLLNLSTYGFWSKPESQDVNYVIISQVDIDTFTEHYVKT